MLVERFGGCLPAECFSWSSVQGVSDCLDLLGAPAGQVGSLREVLAQQAVGVLVRAALPGAGGSAKKTGMPVSTLNWVWADISLPRSQVSDRASCAGRVDIVVASAFFIDIAP